MIKNLFQNIDPRLTKRYQQLVEESMNTNDVLSSGLRPLPKEISSFASTQAAWRFYKNDNVTFAKLQEPLLQMTSENKLSYCKNYALCIHDWSWLNYRLHESKCDKYQITQNGRELRFAKLIAN